ncbi:sensory box histidine kinase/response regulator [Stutzerimonas stutzeri TS44]|nr:sensory box histidine kinase/response regulator [Stutzerimonas stutzeri TS44]
MQRLSFQSLFRASPHAYLLFDPQLRVVDVNPAALALLGRAHHELSGRQLDEAFAGDARFDVAALRASCARALDSRACDALPPFDGNEVHGARLVHTPLLDERGEVVALLQCLALPAVAEHEEGRHRYRRHLEELVDTTAEELSRSETQRRAAEAALLQAQKLEAVGKLTGGIAHDFNNMLQVIGGNLQLLRRNLGADEAALRRLDSAVGGVEKGARLASQLLAFASRQPQRPQPVRLGQLVAQMRELLEGAIGAGVRVELDADEALWPVSVDIGNLQSALIHLATNARDAMRGSGRLLVRLRNRTLQAQPTTGDYVQLSVIDEGGGMAPEVGERAFEPFFTTKQADNASGLGLSMVYGFVKQSGGFVTLDSAAGSGTAVHVYLPRSAEAELATSVPAVTRAEGGLKVLFVEDDPTLRMLTGEVIAELGHQVVLSESAEDALEQLAKQPFDVLLSDVGLAGMSGLELVRRAQRQYPGLALVIASGYAVDAREEGIDSLRVMLKPYDIQQVRELLDTIARERGHAGTAG